MVPTNTTAELDDAHKINEDTIVFIETASMSSATLQSALQKATACRVLLAESGDEAVRIVARSKSRLRLILLTTGKNYDVAIRQINQLKKAVVRNRVPCPPMLILSRIPLGPEAA